MKLYIFVTVALNMKEIHQNLSLLGPNFVEAGAWQNKRTKRERLGEKYLDETIRHLVLRTGCLIIHGYTNIYITYPSSTKLKDDS